MLAVSAIAVDPDNPLAGLDVGERPDPTPPPDWAVVDVRAASLNHHDVWSLRGVGLREEQLPMILGCDASGVDQDGNEVIVHAVIPSPGWMGDETFDPKRSLLSERYDGTLAERVAVPRSNLIAKPAEMSFEEAACLPTAWLTAYRMLFTNSATKPGDTVLVQGAGGGVATALIVLGVVSGRRVWVTSRSQEKLDRAKTLGAHGGFESGARLPDRVDAVFETVGAATWSHSIRSLRPGGTIVTCGATSGDAPQEELTRIFFLQLRIVGSTMGNRDELQRLASFCVTAGIHPVIDSQLPMGDAKEGFRRLIEGDVFGKIVLNPS